MKQLTFKEEIEKITWGVVWYNQSKMFGKVKETPGVPEYHPGEAAKELMRLFTTMAMQIINTPLREGDGLPTDPIIADSIQEAFVRQTQKDALFKRLN